MADQVHFKTGLKPGIKAGGQAGYYPSLSARDLEQALQVSISFGAKSHDFPVFFRWLNGLEMHGPELADSLEKLLGLKKSYLWRQDQIPCRPGPLAGGLACFPEGVEGPHEFRRIDQH